MGNLTPSDTPQGEQGDALRDSRARRPALSCGTVEYNTLGVTLKPIAIVSAAVVAVIALGFCTFAMRDPVVLLSAAWLLGGGWRDPCDRDPIATYLSDYECSNRKASPLNSANVNQMLPVNGQCPLQYAVAHANVAVIDELLSKGADPKACSGYPDSFFAAALGSTCLSNPSQSRELLSLFRRAGIEPTDPQHLLFVAAQRTCEPGIRLAVDRGALVNVEDAAGKSPLHYTVASASDSAIESTQALVELGANPNLALSTGETPLEQAKKTLYSAKNWPRMEAALLARRSQ